MNVFNWIGDLFNRFGGWIEQQIANGGAWLGQQAANGGKWVVDRSIEGVFTIIGESCRFMTEQCTEAFLLFGIVGVFFIMASAREKGTKMINLSIIAFIIMKVLGACM